MSTIDGAVIIGVSTVCLMLGRPFTAACFGVIGALLLLR